MRQLTSLDAQFLALENTRQSGHVAGLAILDPSTAAGGRLGCREVTELLRSRPPLRRSRARPPPRPRGRVRAGPRRPPPSLPPPAGPTTTTSTSATTCASW